MSAEAKGQGRAEFVVRPGETITAMALGPLVETPFPGDRRPHPDNVDYVFVNGTTGFGDLPCRDAVRAFVAERGVPPLAPFDVAAVALPGFNRRLEFSGFWHLPTRLSRWGRARLTPGPGACAIALRTCGGVHLWVDGEHVAGFEPYTRNTSQERVIDLPLRPEGSDLVLLMEDMAERDTVYFAELEWRGAAPLRVSVPGTASPDILHDLMAVARDIRPERVVFEAGTSLSLVVDTPPRRDVTVRARVRPSVHLSHLPPILEREGRLVAGAASVDLGPVADLPAAYHPLDLVLSVGQTVLERHIAFATMPASRPDLAPSLTGRKGQALDHAAHHGEPRAGRLLAHLACGLPWDGTAQTILDDTLGDIVARKDCSDFVMVPLLWAYAAHGAAFPDAARQSTEGAILGYRYWMDEPGHDVMWFWSENHVLCFHVSELLAGQLFPDRTFPNFGLTGAEHAALARARLARWFDAAERDGFAEWNSAAYYPIDFIGLIALWRWAGGDIAARAGALLDRLFEMIALHTLGGVLAGSMGRAYDKELRAGPLTELAPFAAVAFGAGWLNPGVASLPMFCACDYAPPEGLAALARPAIGDRIEARYVQGHGQAARLGLCKTAHVQLSASVDGVPGQPGHQQHMIDVQAAARPFARVWVNHPGEDDPWGSNRPSYWAGNGIMPRVAMDGGMAFALWDLGAAPRLPFTHAYAPLSEFDDWRAGEDWLVLRAGGGGILLKATAPIHAVTSGPGKGLEFRVEGRRAGWIVEVADLEGGGLDALADRARALHLTLDPDPLRLRVAQDAGADYLLDYQRGLFRDGVAMPFPTQDVRPQVTRRTQSGGR